METFEFFIESLDMFSVFFQVIIAVGGIIALVKIISNLAKGNSSATDKQPPISNNKSYPTIFDQPIPCEDCGVKYSAIFMKKIRKELRGSAYICEPCAFARRSRNY